ncbi:MAG TPA: TIGR00266 family protein [Bryobacteraceae bacterium]|nr:TIGR00266 family protein [Bryobacteraceae bacterium]
MTFCTNCGNAIHEGSRFCTSCGQPVAAAPAATVTPPPPPPPPPPPQTPSFDYSIEGGNLQVIRIRLKPGQEIYAEAGKMIYKQSQVVWETRMSGDTLGEKIWGAFKRKLMGESLFLTYFHSSVPGEIGFAGTYPGKIQVFELKPNQSVFVQRDSFLVAQSTTQLNIAFVKRLGAGFFGGEGFILEKLTGPGAVFIHAGGDFMEFNLGPGETLQVDTGSIVAFDEGVSYDIQMVGGIKTAMFGGEGLFLATLTGPGRVIIQSMTLEKMRRELTPFRTGGDTHKGLDAITSIFDNDD